MTSASTYDPSRDPRLNRNISTQGSSIRPQSNNPPVFNEHAALSSDQFLQSISSLIRTAVETSAIQAENDRLQKSKKTSEDLMQRAQSQKHFGSTTAFYENASKEQNANLRRVEEDLRKHQSHYKEIEQGLRSKWSLLTGSSAIDSRLKKLESEVQAAKTATAEANEQTSSLKALNQTLEQQVTELKAQLNELQRSSIQNATNVEVLYATTENLSETTAKHSESLNKLTGTSAPTGISELQQQLDKLQQVSAENANGLRVLSESNTANAQYLDSLSKPEGPISTEITKMAQNVRENVTDCLGSRLQMLDTRIGSMGKDHVKLAAEVKKMEVSVQNHEKKLDQTNVESVIKLYHDWKTVEPRLAKLETSLERINTNPSTDIARASSGPRTSKTSPNPENSGIAQSPARASESQPTYPFNHTIFSEFVRLQEAKDDMLTAEDEKFKENLEKIQQQLHGMQNEHDKLSSQVAGANLAQLVQRLDSLQADHQNLSSQVAAADLAKVVQQIGGMQAEYARFSESLRNIEIIAPGTAIQQLWDSLNSISRNIQSVSVGLHSLETRYNNLSTEPIVKSMVVAMEEMYPSAGQWIEEAKKLRERVEHDVPTLEKKVEHLTRVHESQQTQFEAMTTQYSEGVQINNLMEDVRKELPILKEKIEDLTRVRDCHGQEIGPLKQQIESLAQVQNNQKLDIAPLKQQIGDLRQAQSNHNQEITPLKQQIESLTQAQNNHQMDIAPFKKQIGDLRQVQSSHEQEIAPLRQQIETLVRAQNNHRLEITPLKQQMEDLSQAQASREKELPNLLQKIEQLEKTHRNREEISPLKETIEQVKELSNKLREIQLISDNNSNTLQSHGANLGTLNAAIKRIEDDFLDQLRRIIHSIDHPNESQPRPQESAPATCDGSSTPNRESPLTTAVPSATEDMPLLLSKKKKKKKQIRPSALSDDEQSSIAAASTSNPVASPGPGTQEISAERRRSKKRAHRSSISGDETSSVAAMSTSTPVLSPRPTAREMSTELNKPKKKKRKQSNMDNAILID